MYLETSLVYNMSNVTALDSLPDFIEMNNLDDVITVSTLCTENIKTDELSCFRGTRIFSKSLDRKALIHNIIEIKYIIVLF